MHIHLVGIGGSGLSAIARLLHQRGFIVSGSDRKASETTRALSKDGIHVHIGHDAGQIGAAEMIIYTSALDAEGQREIQAAQVKGIPCHRRSEIMQQVIGNRPTIAVAGTHGKTTTTAMLIHLLRKCGHSPGFILGSTLPTGENAALGKDDLFVIEADEYDYMFLGIEPLTAIVTNIEHDHPDCFATVEDIYDAYRRFLSLLPETGSLVHNADDPGTRYLMQNRQLVGHECLSFGREMTADLRLANLQSNPQNTLAECWYADEKKKATLCLQLAGEHNLFNAAAAILAAERHGVPFEEAVMSLADFSGVERRMTLRADVKGLALIDDYAHHPTAIRATLQAAKQRYPDRQLVAIWQPHTYSRLLALWDEYVSAFALADSLLVTEVFAAREKPLANVDGANITKAIRHPRKVFEPDQAKALRKLSDLLSEQNVVLILSAGDAPALGEAVLENWVRRASIG